MKGGTITEDDPSKPRRTVISTMILILENMRFTFLLTITLFMVICIYIIYTIKEIVLPDVILFEWDDGNSTKSWVKHKVSIKEQEEAFFDKNKRAFEDEKHSTIEQRFLLFGKTRQGRRLLIAFTKRGEYKEKIRCISARTMKRKEAKIYEETTKAA